MAALDKPSASRHPHRSRRRRCADSLRPPTLLRQPPLPAARTAIGVQNPCPTSTSHNHRCQRVLGRSGHGTPARLRPRLHHRPAPQLQVDALTAAGYYRAFTETTSGARPDRPTLEQLLDQLRPGDTLVVWKLDRLGRSLRHLVDTVTGLADRGVGFCSLQEAIDTTTPGGKLVFHVFAALAEFERDLIRERTTAGLTAARARGRHGGRPSVLTGHKLQVAEDMYRSGQYTVAAIAT